jgi:hypothetical protein
MDIEAIYGAVKSALGDLSAYAEVKGVAKHPDVWIKQGETLPVISLVFADGTFDHENGGDKQWTQAVRSRLNLEIHLVINSSPDNLALEFVRQFNDIQDAIVTLTKTPAFNALGRAYVADFQIAHADTGAWIWAVMRLVVGE